MIITIDGPVASGKSTVARLLAQKLGFYYLYTGFLYRGFAYVLAHAYNYDTENFSCPRDADVDDIIYNHTFEYRYEEGQPKIIFDGNDITPFLKTKEVDNWASLVSAYPHVRHVVFEHQVRIGKAHDVVAEGRDTGTVVFPSADYKFFLTSPVEVRAERWQRMQQKMGFNYSLEECLKAVRERDARDADRSHSPLRRAPEALYIDNAHMTISETIDLMLQKMKRSPA